MAISRPRAESSPLAGEAAPEAAASRGAGSQMTTKTSLSVLVPFYDEEHLVYTSLERLGILETGDLFQRIEVIVVDECSTDRSRDVLDRFRVERTGGEHSKVHWTFVHYPTNVGKGSGDPDRSCPRHV
jgi:hypothetical protein